MQAPIIVMVRARKDAKALRAAVERFYPDWPIEVVSLHGVRRGEELLDAVMAARRRGSLHLVLLGRREAEAARLVQEEAPLDTVAHIVPRARVRNARLEMIAWELMNALSVFTSGVYYRVVGGRCVYAASPKPPRGFTGVEGLPAGPGADPFLGLGAWRRLLSRRGLGVGADPLIVKTGVEGEHYVYQAGRRAARLVLGHESTSVEDYGGWASVDVDVGASVAASLGYLRVLEEAAVSMLRRAAEEHGVERVVVPWSGGKDSTAALLLALKAFGRSMVDPVYVDTGLDYSLTRRYLDHVSGLLGVEYSVVEAPVARLVREGWRLSIGYRWCTGLKLEALRSYVERVGCRTMLVVGDRGAESQRRMRRTPLGPERLLGAEARAAPMKAWSALHVQLYLLANRVPLHPLYSLGFYRIGCSVCPSLRRWEVEATLSSRVVRGSVDEWALRLLLG